MTRLSLVLFLLALATATPALSAGEPLVRVRLPGNGPFLVGQPISLAVQVLAPNYFMSAPQFPATLDISGAVVTLPAARAVNSNETIDGQAYSGVEVSYLVIAERPGKFTVPPATIAFAYAAVPGQPTAGSVTLPSAAFEAALPPGAEGQDGPLPVTPLAISQSLDRDPTRLKAGDAVTRTVTIAAKDLPAMMIPPPEIGAPPEAKIYPRDPVLSDGSGGSPSRRTDRVTYVFETPGEYELPAVQASWFDPVAGKPASASVPAVKLVVAPATATTAIAPEVDEATDQAAPARARWVRLAAGAIAALALLAILAAAARRYLPRLNRHLAARREARRASEPACFARLEAACRDGNPLAAYRALTAWADRAGCGPLDAWADAVGSAALREEVAALERLLFRPADAATAWNGIRLREAVAAARRSWQQSDTAERTKALPELNPWNQPAPETRR
jgi:hypothetical protein